ncbi:MAG TPA: hypothetical protein VKT21_06310, partial [Thermoplasmata archaeon]|nr:hypothetical protein [Thermoplasmata archaeon]
TAPTYRQALEERLKRWDRFAALLPTPEERTALEELRTSVRRYIPQSTYGGSPDLTETIFLSILLDLRTRQGAAPSPSAPARRPVAPNGRPTRRVRRWRRVGCSTSPKDATEPRSSSG